MAARNTTLRYGSVAMGLHWVIALLVVANIALGVWFGEFMERGDPLLFPVVQLHKSIGLSVLLLSVLRLIWRLIHPVPALPAWMGPGMRFVAHSSHFLLYVFILVIPLSGWLMVSASPLGNGTNFFGLFVLPNLPFFAGQTRAQLRPTHELFETIHVVLAWATVALVPIHVAAALYHHYSHRDDVLRRMLPGTTVEGENI